MLFLLTLLHLFVDGICGATLCAYAVNESTVEPILFVFATYNLVAFGMQGVGGFLLDRWPTLLPYAFVLALLLLWLGAYAELVPLGVFILGSGNFLFHAAGGKYVLEQYTRFTETGVFVSSGAIGLALGLNGIVPPLFFLVPCSLITILVVYLLPRQQRSTSSDLPSPQYGYFFRTVCLLLLLICIILRGFGGKDDLSEYVMLLPFVFAFGKAFGGILCDRIGYHKTLLCIFLVGFIALQCEGLLPLLLLVLVFNMTMPLTLRLAYLCYPGHAGLLFGVAASCLLPGAFFASTVTLPPQTMLGIAYLTLFGAAALLQRVYHKSFLQDQV